MKKTVSFIFAVIMLIGSFAVTSGAADAHKALSWPENYYDFNHKAPDPSPWLGELEVGENNVSSLLKGYYTFTAPETGYYYLGSWFEESLKIEDDEVTEINYVGFHGPFNCMIYLEKGIEHCFRFFNNSGVEDNSDMTEPGDIEITYIGQIVSAKPEENAHAYLRDLYYDPEYPECPYTLTNVNVDVTFSEGLVLQDSWMSGKIDSTEPGRRKFTVPEICGGPGYDFEFTLLGYDDYIDDIKLGEGYIQTPGDFYSRLEISYNNLEAREENGEVFYLCNDNTPNTITITLKDGTVLNLEPEYYYYFPYGDGIAGNIQGCEWFTAGDGSSHNITAGYKENEKGRIVFYVQIDGTETVIEEDPICYASLLKDFMTFCQNLKAALKTDGSITEKFEAAKTEASTFALYCKYVFSNGYFANTGIFKELLKYIGK